MWPCCQHKLVKFIKLKLTCELWLVPGFVLVLYLKKVQRLFKQCFFALLQLDNSFINDRQITALSLRCRNLQQDKKCKILQTGFKKKKELDGNNQQAKSKAEKSILKKIFTPGTTMFHRFIQTRSLFKHSSTNSTTDSLPHHSLLASYLKLYYTSRK